MFGTMFKLRIHGDKSYTTLLGSFLTLMWIGFSILMTVYFIRKQTDTTQPFVNTSPRVDEKAPARNLYDLKYHIALTAIDPTGKYIPIDEIYRYGAPYIKIQEMFMENIEQGEAGFKVLHYWPFKKCSDIKDTRLT
jgi:hypothetical protein